MEMKRNLLLLIGLCMAVCVQAQKKNFSYKFYGQVRGDLFYNSRANAEIVDGLFHLYPKDVALDADGKDLNASPNGSFYLLYSRLGIDVQGPKVGSAKTSLKLGGAPYPSCLCESGLGQVRCLDRTDMASAIWRGLSTDVESFYRRPVPAL